MKPRPILMVILTLALLATPLVADAQPASRVYRIGYLSPGRPSSSFLDELHRLGWTEGEKIVLEDTNPQGDLSRMPALATELVRCRVDVIVIVLTISDARANRIIE